MESGTIVVVDDLLIMVKLAEAVLGQAGYSVRGTDDPNTALGWARDSGDEISLLITDMHMTGMKGQDLALQIEGHCPDVRVIFMSGDPPEYFGFVPDERHAYLKKPFRNQALLDCVQELKAA